MRTFSGNIGRMVLIILVGGLSGLARPGSARAQCLAGTLVSQNNREFDRFGLMAAMEGNRVAIGAPSGDGREADTGAVYVYDLRSVAPWGRTRERFEITAPDGDRSDGFFRVALEGNRLVVGASGG